MADILWPITLQQKLSVAEFSYKLGDTAVRSNMDVGPDKIRRRTTKSVDQYTCSIVIDFSQWEAVRDFYNVTLNGGVNQFVFKHPFKETDAYFRFLTAPTMRPNGGRSFVVSMSWEHLE